MNSLHFSITINAPKARVHQLMLADQTYREWANEFAEASYYRGSWDKGAQIQFLVPQGGGINARIAEHRPAEFVSIEMLNMMQDDVTDAPNQWNDIFENYTYIELNGITTVQVVISGAPDEWGDYLNTAWPKALAKLKTICEHS
jgi:hypothetical protein